MMVLNADGTDRDLLDEEGLGTTDAFVALTGTDEVNMLMGMYAQREGVPGPRAGAQGRVLGDDRELGAAAGAGDDA